MSKDEYRILLKRMRHFVCKCCRIEKSKRRKEWAKALKRGLNYKNKKEIKDELNEL